MSANPERLAAVPGIRRTSGELSDGFRIAALGLSCTLAVILGFVIISPEKAEGLIVHGGYYSLLLVLVLWIAAGGRVLAKAWRERSGRGWEWRLLVVALVCALFAAASDERGHKILYDEYVIQGTAWNLHANKQVAAPLRAYEIAGAWTAIDTYLDKRPYFYALLVSLTHDVTGFRVANAFFLNSFLSLACVALTGWIALALTRRREAAALAMVLLATTPLFGQNASGAGIEMLNLTMIAAVAVAGILCLRSPGDPERQSFLALGGVLLAQCRYESALFSLPVAAILATSWRRAGRVSLPWPVICTPLLMIPYAWHSRVVDAKPQLWELRQGESARFGWSHVSGNLEGARKFFLSVSPEQPGSLALVLLGAVGAVLLVVRILRRRGTSELPAASAVAWVGVGVGAHFVVLQFYYWARFDEPETARFALPSLLMLALLAAGALHFLADRGKLLSRCFWAAWAVWLTVLAAPTYAHRLYSRRNLVVQEVEWELAEVRSRPGPVLVLTSKATLPHLLHQIPALSLAMARQRAPEIAWHLQRGSFREVLVSQVVRPTTAAGDAGVDPADTLPDGFRLEAIERKRFGARWVRLSRLVGVEPGPPVTRPAD